MRTEMTFPSRIVKRGNGYFIPVMKAHVDLMNLDEGTDIDVTISLPKTDEQSD